MHKMLAIRMLLHIPGQDSLGLPAFSCQGFLSVSSRIAFFLFIVIEVSPPLEFPGQEPGRGHVHLPSPDSSRGQEGEGVFL